MTEANCRGCKGRFNTVDLFTKQVRWRKSGPLGSVAKSKNIGHYCKGCMEGDEQFNILTRPEIREELLRKVK